MGENSNCSMVIRIVIRLFIKKYSEFLDIMAIIGILIETRMKDENRRGDLWT